MNALLDQLMNKFVHFDIAINFQRPAGVIRACCVTPLFGQDTTHMLAFQRSWTQGRCSVECMRHGCPRLPFLCVECLVCEEQHEALCIPHPTY